MRITNYHSHTCRCQHAFDTEEDYVLQAIQTGYQILGFADHTPWPYKSDFVASMRMRISQFSEYVETLRALREKYRDQIDLRIGLECEAFPEFYPWLREIRDKGLVEYFILGNHYDTSDENHDGWYFGACKQPEQLYRYMETTIAGMDSGLFAYLAHPDIFLHQYPVFDEAARTVSLALAREAKRLRMPLEYNLLGYRRRDSDHAHGNIGYTSDEFWETVAEVGGTAIIGVDAHSAAHLDCADLYAQAHERLNELGFTILETLD